MNKHSRLLAVLVSIFTLSLGGPSYADQTGSCTPPLLTFPTFTPFAATPLLGTGLQLGCTPTAPCSHRWCALFQLRYVDDAR